MVITPDASGAGRPARCSSRCAGLHAYIDDGRRVCWRPGRPGRFAMDAERIGQPVPEHLARRWHEGGHKGESFWHAWTLAEALTKLEQSSILVRLRTHGMDAEAPDGVHVEHRQIGDLLLCCVAVLP